MKWVASVLCLAQASFALYAPIKEYSGESFFNDWTYYGFIDNTTWGNVSYVDEPTAQSQGLTFVNPAGNAIIRVDNTTNIDPAPLVNRNTVRITTTDTYPIGSLIIADVLHIPYGCSVWPSFWTLGIGMEWPHAGEIDIIEGINLMGNNQYSVHTDPPCMQAPNPNQLGRTLNRNCSQPRGCSVAETKPNSFGSAFANAGGGVFALQMDVEGIYLWFWSRPDVPKSILDSSSSATLDTADWGLPSAAYPATCDLATAIQPQQLVITITLCGHWAGLPNRYAETCPGTCIPNIFGSGNPIYNDAYFEFKWIRTFAATNSSAAASLTVTETATITSSNLPSGTSSATNSNSSLAFLPQLATILLISWTLGLGFLGYFYLD